METPSSAATRRITRSQAYAAANYSDNVSALKKVGDYEEESLKSRQSMKQQDRSALIDITNDSPIVGLAMGISGGTPSSLISKKGGYNINNTPGSGSGSGEALLRGQVKNLLQKVEEKAAEISKLSSVPRRHVLHHLQGQFFNSPMCHLAVAAPTPANTPEIISNPSAILSDNNNSIGLASILESVDIPFPQGETEKDVMVTRSLMLDFSDDHETYEDEKEIEEEINNNDDRDFDEEENGGDGGLVDELCQAISKMKFCGKHTKFVYNSDDEIEGEEEVFSSGMIDESCSSSAFKLQGCPPFS